MMTFFRFTFFHCTATLILLLCCTSCYNGVQLEFSQGEPLPFEDFPDLVSLLEEKKESLRYNKVRKTITHEGSTEMMLLDSAGWSDNMEFFYNSHISRILLEDRYNTITQASGDTLHFIAFATDDNLFTEYQKFSMVNNQWVRLEVLNRRRTLLFDMSQHLSFDLITPWIYVVVSRKAMFSDPVETSMEIEFL